MFKECKCGNIITIGECKRCGRVYDVEIIVNYNEEKTLKTIKRFIVDNSNVTRFSEYWKLYYDWDCAGKETINAYLNDIDRHKKQVEEFLNKFTDKELFETREELLKNNTHEIANRILEKLGYVFIES